MSKWPTKLFSLLFFFGIKTAVASPSHYINIKLLEQGSTKHFVDEYHDNYTPYTKTLLTSSNKYTITITKEAGVYLLTVKTLTHNKSEDSPHDTCQFSSYEPSLGCMTSVGVYVNVEINITN